MYESVHRIKKTISQLYQIGGDRQCIIGRELTKMYEQLYTGTLASALDAIEQ